MTLGQIFNIDKNVIQVDNNKNIKLLSQNLINIALEASQSIKETKKHDLILEIAISHLKDRLSFVTFFDLYLIIDATKI